MSTASPDLSIVIPCYNEEDRVGPTLEQLSAFLQGRPQSYEIITVNDGSIDRTSDKIREKAAVLPSIQLLESARNRGKGATVRKGMLAARGRYVIFTDADLATPPDEIPRLLKALETSPVAIGIRIQDDGTDMRSTSQPAHRRFLGKIFTLLASLLVVRGFKDTQCGFKGFVQEACQAIFSRVETEGIVFDVEVLCLARRLGYAVTQVPIQWKDPGGSKMMVRTQKAVEVVRELLAIRRRVNSMAQNIPTRS